MLALQLQCVGLSRSTWDLRSSTRMEPVAPAQSSPSLFLLILTKNKLNAIICLQIPVRNWAWRSSNKSPEESQVKNPFWDPSVLWHWPPEAWLHGVSLDCERQEERSVAGLSASLLPHPPNGNGLLGSPLLWRPGDRISPYPCLQGVREGRGWVTVISLWVKAMGSRMWTQQPGCKPRLPDPGLERLTPALLFPSTLGFWDVLSILMALNPSNSPAPTHHHPYWSRKMGKHYKARVYYSVWTLEIDERHIRAD